MMFGEETMKTTASWTYLGINELLNAVNPSSRLLFLSGFPLDFSIYLFKNTTRVSGNIIKFCEMLNLKGAARGFNS